MRTTNDVELECRLSRFASAGVLALLVMCTAPFAIAEEAPKPKLLNAPAVTGSLKPADGAPSTKAVAVKPSVGLPLRTPAQQTADKAERDAMTYAAAAVEAGYPWPAHALYLSGELQLTTQQNTAIVDIAARLKARAAQLDPRIEAAESNVATAFAAGLPDTAKWSGALRESEKVRVELRQAHLIAHADVWRILSTIQREAYVKLRSKLPQAVAAVPVGTISATAVAPTSTSASTASPAASAKSAAPAISAKVLNKP